MVYNLVSWIFSEFSVHGAKLFSLMSTIIPWRTREKQGFLHWELLCTIPMLTLLPYQQIRVKDLA